MDWLWRQSKDSHKPFKLEMASQVVVVVVVVVVDVAKGATVVPAAMTVPHPKLAVVIPQT